MPRQVKAGHVRMGVTMQMTLPATVGRAELRAYIKDAVSTWGGQRHLDDHLFYTIKDISISFTSMGEAPPSPPKDYSYPMLWRATEGRINPDTLTALREEFDRFMADARKMFAPLPEPAVEGPRMNLRGATLTSGIEGEA